MLEHSGARLVLCEDERQVAKVEQIRAACPALEHVVMLTGSADGALELAELDGGVLLALGPATAVAPREPPPPPGMAAAAA